MSNSLSSLKMSADLSLFVINAIGFLFLTQHTTPLLYVKIHFGVLHIRGTDVSRSDTPLGSKRPHLQVGVSKSVQTRYLCRRVLPLLICSVRYVLLHPLWRYKCAKKLHISRALCVITAITSCSITVSPPTDISPPKK